MLFKNTSKRIMSICASGRGFTEQPMQLMSISVEQITIDQHPFSSIPNPATSRSSSGFFFLPFYYLLFPTIPHLSLSFYLLFYLLSPLFLFLLLYLFFLIDLFFHISPFSSTFLYLFVLYFFHLHLLLRPFHDLSWK